MMARNSHSCDPCLSFLDWLGTLGPFRAGVFVVLAILSPKGMLAAPTMAAMALALKALLIRPKKPSAPEAWGRSVYPFHQPTGAPAKQVAKAVVPTVGRRLAGIGMA